MRTHDFEYFKIPAIPGLITITMSDSVTSIEPSLSCKKILNIGDEASFVVGPVWFSSQLKERQIWLDYDEKAKIDFPSKLAGKLNVGGKDVFIFLEN